MKVKVPVFNRIGSKQRLLNVLQSYIPENQLFVEPFVGSGTVFLNLSGDSKIVINDLDKSLIRAYKYMKRLKVSDYEKYQFLDKNKNQSSYIYEMNKIWNKLQQKENLSGEEHFVKQLLSALTFSGVGKGKLYNRDSNIYNRFTKRIPDMIDKLRNSVILNKSYEKVLKEYDSKDTFFYLDPPYENSKDLYKHYSLTLEELERNVRSLKGKVLISLNDSPKVRNIFRNYNIISLRVKSNGNNISSGIGSKVRSEVLIMNFTK